ncbi:serine hydrolase [Thermoflexibacter ruber]|uniref:Beta-lactamase enzyme family protein n=1 Tax=Thermoflexibacter ruber TaxID=1003 RepID=A0A1I2GSM0_9BACT|nr:serine hydrolase [Thermoflexibacter ruber]SFF20934.1 Beta-lactamase enzyme family protein [Thermoflexibacter ruber]
MKKILLLNFFLFQFFFAFCQTKKIDTQFLEQLLQNNKNFFAKVLQNPAKYQIQIIYSQIDRDENNLPSFKDFHYRVDKSFYFYPASTVKMPAAFLALEKLNELNIKGLNKYSRMKIDSGYTGQTKVVYDSSAKDYSPSIAHYIKKLFAVSDNDAFNRLYEFLGQEYLNEKLYQKGFQDLRITHRLSIGDGGERAKYTNPMSFYEGENEIYRQPMAYNKKSYPFKLKNQITGKGFIRQNELVNQPMDFTNSNYISLENLHEILKAVMFPEITPENQRFNLSEEDYRFLYQSLSILPRECDYPDYKKDTTYNDYYVKFLMYGDGKKKVEPEKIRIFNKVGNAYGYLIDTAYIVDFENQIEFMLSAVIHVNENQIFNDGVYEYDGIGYPFLANLGRVIYEHELKRKRSHKPNLQKYKVH